MKPKQKSVELVLDMVFMFFEAAELFPNTCTDRLAITKPYWQLFEPLQPLRCEKHTKHFYALLWLLEIHAK